VKDWFTADGALKPGAGALVDPYAFEHKLRGQSPFRCERTRANILSQALHFACANARLEVAEFLLARGADLDAIVPGLDSRATVLHLLASMEAGRGRTRDNAHRVVRFLAAQGADLDARDEVFRSTPLGWAQFLRRHETADLLRSLGAST
jgi:hypothetical protein